MGQLHRFLGLSVGIDRPRRLDARARSARSTTATSRTAPTTSSASTTSATTWSSSIEDQVQRGQRYQSWSPHYFAIVDEVDSILIDEARTPLIISGRAADAAELYYQFARVVRGLQRDRDYEVDEAKRTVVPDRGGHRARRGGARRREPLRERPPELRAPAPAGAARQGAVQARRRLHRPGRRGEDRRRVHRPHPRRPPLERRSAPGRRGQGGREDQGGEPDPRDGHAAELLPHVREALAA